MQKSYSLPKLSPPSSLQNRQGSVRTIEPRLNFPLPGDSSIFAHVGRKHFENHSDRMLKIILPEKYSSQKSTKSNRELSLPPPHLIRHNSQQISENKFQISTQPKRVYTKDTSLRQKIDDELDKMRKSMQKHKTAIKTPIYKDIQKQVNQKMTQNTKSSRQNQIRINNNNLFTLSPAISTKVQSKQQLGSGAPMFLYNSPKLLYNPQNKEKYDNAAKRRWNNPTNLSTGLSII